MEQKPNETKQRSARTYQSQGMAIGIALGLIFGLLLDQIAVGLVLGIAVGVGMGRTLELQAQKKKDEET
jgi:hypothetical protein